MYGAIQLVQYINAFFDEKAVFAVVITQVTSKYVTLHRYMPTGSRQFIKLIYVCLIVSKFSFG